MNHKLLSNMLFGCSIATGLESFYMIQRDLYYDAFTLGCLAILIMYISWVIFKHREED